MINNNISMLVTQIQRPINNPKYNFTECCVTVIIKTKKKQGIYFNKRTKRPQMITTKENE